MKSLRSSLAAAAVCGLLMTAAVPAFAAAPKDYQITGTVSVLTDSTMTLVTNQKQNWDFARGTDTKLPDGVKVGDKVTVHYTMTAGAVEAKPADAAKGAGKKADKAVKKSKAADTGTAPASGSPNKPAAESPSPTP